MKSEKQTSFDTDVDVALDIASSSQSVDSPSNVIPFPVDRVRTDELSSNAYPEPEALSEPDQAEAQAAAADRKHEKFMAAFLLAATGVAGVAMLPRGGEAQPVPQPESFTDLAQESAQHAYNPETDELVIDGIRIKPGKPNRNSASEAVLGNAEVKNYMASNPNEASSLEASTMVLPTNESGEYVVVKRDIDHDGDTDAVAVSAE